MKKILTFITLTTLVNSSFAMAEKPQPEQPAPFEGKPAVILQVIDTSKKTAKPVDGTKLSISKKHNTLCWRTVNIPVLAKVGIAEAIYAPEAFKLSAGDSKVTASADNKMYTIVSEVNSVQNQYIQRCWTFDKTDPKGKYQLEIQIGDIVFKGLEFEVAK